MSNSGSSLSTPRKRKRQTWNTLVSGLKLEAHFSGSIDLENVLSSVEPDFEAFYNCSDIAKRAILEEALGDHDELVDIILCNVGRKLPPPSIADRLQSYDIAPSNISIDIQPAILRAIISNDAHIFFGDFAELVHYIKMQLKDTEQIDLKQESSVASVTVLNFLRQSFIYMFQHESDGYPSVAILCTCIKRELTARFPQEFFTCTSQFAVAKINKPGQGNPATDVAVLHKNSIDSQEWIPIIIIEYKPRLNSLLTLVESAYLLELFVQVYYAMKYYKIESVIGSITDISSWHTFKFTMADDGKMKINLYMILQMDLTVNCDDAQVKQIISMFIQLYES